MKKSPGILLGLAVSGAAWAALLADSNGGRPWVWSPALLMALTLELTASRLGDFGFYSCAFGGWLAVVVDSPGSGRLLALALASCVVVRRLLYDSSARLLVVDFAPTLVALAVATLGGNWMAAALIAEALYLGLTHLAHGALFQAHADQLAYLRRWTGYQRLAEGFAGLLAVVLARDASPWSLLVWPLLWAVRRSVRADWRNLSLLEEERRERKAAQKELEVVRLTKTVQVQQIAEAVWRELGRELVASSSLEATLEVALRFVHRVVRVVQVAVYVSDGQALVPPPPPFVEQAWRENAVRTVQGAVAYPLEGQGVLYLARPEPFSEEERHLVVSFASQLALGMLSARRFQENLLVQGQMMHSSKLVAIGQLAAGVAHELNTPLGAATLQLEMAQEMIDPHPATRKIEVAQRALAQCQGIIGRLLYYAREGASSRAHHDLNQVVADTLELLGKPLGDSGVELLSTPANLPQVHVNAGEIQQVVTNLLLNARDACLEPEARGRRIELRTSSDGRGAYLQVIDQGAGLAEAARTRMFEPFFTTKPQGQGMGLGLSVSLQIVEQHGGRLSAVSVPEGGTCFTLALPLATGREAR